MWLLSDLVSKAHYSMADFSRDARHFLKGKQHPTKGRE